VEDKGQRCKRLGFSLLGIVQLGLGRLLEGLLNGLEGISICKRIRAVLKSLDGPMGCGVGPPPLRTSSRRVKGLRKVQLKPSRIRKGVGVGLLLKSKRETCLKRSHRVRPLASENTSLGATLQAPKVRLGASANVSSMPKRALGGVSGSVDEGLSVPVSPLHVGMMFNMRGFLPLLLRWWMMFSRIKRVS
jgi:hypothetical protein